MKQHLLSFGVISLLGACDLPATEGGMIERWDRVPPPALSMVSAQGGLFGTRSWTWSFGGHARSMVEVYRNRDFGLIPLADDAWIHHRLQSSLTLNHQKDFWLAATLASGEIQGKQVPLSPVDRDDPDLGELYAQMRWVLADGSAWMLRAGRQILFYGSGRLLAHREGANQRLTHDALRLGWSLPNNDWQIDALLTSPVRIRPGAFDNGSYWNRTLLWGLYAVGPSPFGGEGHGIDLYYLGLRQENALLAGPAGVERRHTFGSRWWGDAGSWGYNSEFILQTGTSGPRDIFAGAVSLGGERRFDSAPLKPALGLKADLISGGGSATTTNTFNPLFQANNYFNEGGFVSPSNLWNLNPSLRLNPTRTLSLTLGVNFLWRFDSGDAVYGPPFSVVAPAAPNADPCLGTAFNVALAWDPHPSVSLSFGFTHHEAGPSLTAIGGQDVDYLQTALRIEF